MATRVDRLQVSLEAINAERAKADIAGVAQAEREVGTAAREAAPAVANLESVINDLGGRGAVKASDALAELARRKKEAARAADEAAEAEKREEQARKASESAAKAQGQLLQRLGVGAAITAALAFTVTSIKAYEDLEARIKSLNETQEAADNAMALIRAGAAGTTASVLEMGEAYATLRKHGMEPTVASLQALANWSAVTGKSIEEVARMIGTAASGEVEGLRQLGITAKKSGDDLILTFEGTTRTIKAGSVELLAYLEEIGNSRYGDAAANQADTISGAVSRLKTEAEELAAAIGESGVGAALQYVIDKAAEATGGLARFFREGTVNNKPESSWGLAATVATNQTLHNLFGFTMFQSRDGKSDADAAAAAEARAVAQRALNAELEMGARNLQILATEDEKANEKGRQALEQLQARLETTGQARSAAVAYAAEQAASKVADADLAAQIRATGKALADKLRALEADKKATKDTKDAKRELREELSEHDKIYRQYMRELMADEQATIDLGREKGKLREKVDALAASFDKTDDRVNDLVRAEKLLEEAFRKGVITLEEYDKILSKVFAAEDKMTQGNRAASLWSAVTGAKKEDAEQTVEQLGDAFANMFADALVNGFEDAGGQLRSFLKGVLRDSFAETINNKIVKNVGNAMNGGQLNTGDLASGVGQIGGTYLGANVGGGGEYAQMGAGTGAMIGATYGSAFGPIGTVVGAILGGIIGGLAGGLFDGAPEVDVRAPGTRNYAGQEAYAVGPYGAVGVSTDGMKNPKAQELAQAIVGLDTTIARMLTAEENRRVREALSDFYIDNARSPADAMAQRLNAIIAEVEPHWVAFLNRYNDVQERASAFGALRGMRDMLEDIDTITDQLVGGSLDQLRNQLRDLDSDVDSAMEGFRSAYEAGTPVEIEAEGKRAMEAIIARYNAEIQMVQELQAAIEQAQAEAYQLNLTLAQRIAGITGDYSGAVTVTSNRRNELQDAIIAADSASRALSLLNQFVTSVDNWVSARQQEINAELAAGLADIERRRQAAQAAAQREQQAAAARNAAIQAQIAALQEQLRLAQEWLNVLRSVEAQQNAMQFGAANPLDAFGRLDALDQAIAALLAGGMDGMSAADANELLSLLEQRLQLIQSEGLFDRPSGDYDAQYNETLRLLDAVRRIAQPEAERAEALQELIASLQAQLNTTTSNGFSDTNATLERLAQEEADLRAEAQQKLDDLNAEALAYYEWARDEAERNQDERTRELREQLEELTGGLDVQEFIALRQQEAVDLLSEISRDIREFLTYVGVTIGGGTGIGGGSGGGGGGGSNGGNSNNTNAAALPAINIELSIDARGSDPDAIAGTVQREVLRMVPTLARELRVA